MPGNGLQGGRFRAVSMVRLVPGMEQGGLWQESQAWKAQTDPEWVKPFETAALPSWQVYGMKRF
jgi:hypothetical protein